MISCAMSIPDNAGDDLAPPVITDSWQDGKYIIIQFRGYNDEYYFDGYNVYVSETTIKKTDIESYKAVELEGLGSTTPSFPLSPDDYDPDRLREVTLYHYYWYMEDTGKYEKYPFSTGTYYIRMCSHHSLNGVDEDGVSNQITFDFVD